MSAINFQETFKGLKDEALKLALATFTQYKDQAKTDAVNLVESLKVNLEKWTIQLAEGKLSKDDFEFLVLAQKELIEMNALKQAGVTLIKADEFKNSLLNLVVKTVIGLI
ncbi:MAG TPA: hypothetical protein VFC65_02225 [Prolixibacteraceae bacterium]|nr:hypothetical protein [Prolixibacteraceae bacterium]